MIKELHCFGFQVRDWGGERWECKAEWNSLRHLWHKPFQGCTHGDLRSLVRLHLLHLYPFQSTMLGIKLLYRASYDLFNMQAIEVPRMIFIFSMVPRIKHFQLNKEEGTIWLDYLFVCICGSLKLISTVKSSEVEMVQGFTYWVCTSCTVDAGWAHLQSL